MNTSVWGGTRNGGHHVGTNYTDAQLDAAGFDRKHKGAQPKFNGGVVAHREIRLRARDKLYRFCGSTVKGIENQARGRWWFDEEMCVLLWSLSNGTDQGFREAARTMFAVLPEWSDMNFCVSGWLKYDYWAILGMTAQARSKSGTASNRHGHEARQLYVPGMLDKDSFGLVRPVGLTRLVY